MTRASFANYTRSSSLAYKGFTEATTRIREELDKYAKTYESSKHPCETTICTPCHVVAVDGSLVFGEGESRSLRPIPGTRYYVYVVEGDNAKVAGTAVLYGGELFVPISYDTQPVHEILAGLKQLNTR